MGGFSYMHREWANCTLIPPFHFRPYGRDYLGTAVFPRHHWSSYLHTRVDTNSTPPPGTGESKTRPDFLHAHQPSCPTFAKRVKTRASDHHASGLRYHPRSFSLELIGLSDRLTSTTPHARGIISELRNIPFHKGLKRLD
jgi:hypothetical protein